MTSLLFYLEIHIDTHVLTMSLDVTTILDLIELSNIIEKGCRYSI